MVRDALQFAAEFREIEKNTKEQLAPVGVVLGWEAIADAQERLAAGRFWVLAYLTAAKSKATKAERRELDAVIKSFKAS